MTQSGELPPGMPLTGPPQGSGESRRMAMTLHCCRCDEAFEPDQTIRNGGSVDTYRHVVCPEPRDRTAKPTHTPRRSIRIGEELWHAAQEKAAERGETVTDVLVRALQRYVKR